MLKIAIFGSSNQSTLIKEYLVRYSICENIELNVLVLSQWLFFLNSFKENIFDLFLFDIDSKEIDIQQIDSYLIGRKTDAAIIFITAQKKCPVELIKLHPIDCLNCQITYEVIKNCMDKYIESKYCNNMLFKYKKNRTECKINVSRILYLQSSGKKVVIHTKKEEIEFYGKLSECMNYKCFNNFIRIHQSFFVNPQYIERIERNCIIISENIRLPISRNKYRKIIEWSKK